MMRKLSQAIFLRTTRYPRFTFSKQGQSKETQTQTIKENQAVQPKQQKTTSQNQDEQFQYQKQDRSTKGWMIYRFLFWGTVSVLGYNIYKVASHQKKTPIEDEPGTTPGFITVAKILYQEYVSTTQFLTKPPVQKLLPDILHPLMHPKTLVLNVTGTLLETDYVFGKGLIIKKRPGLNQFLKKMGQSYQVIIFSDDDSCLIQTLLPSLDPRQQIIAGYFGNQSMVLSGRHYIKDLKYLNRDLRNVIVIDNSKDKLPKHRQNVITLPIFHGDSEDRELYNLTALLENLNKPNVRDVRKTLVQLGEDPLKQFTNNMKQKQQKIKGNKSNKVFGFFSKK